MLNRISFKKQFFFINCCHLGKTESFKDSFDGSTTNIGKIGMAFYMGLWAYDGW